MYNSNNLLAPMGHESHAFDTPFEVMKALRRDFNDLQAAFQAEQQQRAVEIQQLRSEVSMLKDTLGKESNERKGIDHQLIQDMTQLKSDKLKAVEELKVGLARTLQELSTMIRDEVRDRKASDSLRDTREATEKSERISDSTSIKDDAVKHKQAFYASRDSVIKDVNDIKHDIEMIATAMAKVSLAKGKLSKESLQCYKYFNGQASLPITGPSN